MRQAAEREFSAPTTSTATSLAADLVERRRRRGRGTGLRELRESLIRGRVPGGARWEVPLRAAIAVAVAALMVVAVVVVFLLRSDGGSEGALIDESAPLVSTSAAQPVPSSAPDVTAVADSTPSPGPCVCMWWVRCVNPA